MAAGSIRVTPAVHTQDFGFFVRQAIFDGIINGVDVIIRQNAELSVFSEDVRVVRDQCSHQDLFLGRHVLIEFLSESVNVDDDAADVRLKSLREHVLHGGDAELSGNVGLIGVAVENVLQQVCRMQEVFLCLFDGFSVFYCRSGHMNGSFLCDQADRAESPLKSAMR